MIRLSKAQQSVLLRALEKRERVIYGTRGDTTLHVLARHGFANWESNVGNKYGKPYWWITDDGMAEAQWLARGI